MSVVQAGGHSKERALATVFMLALLAGCDDPKPQAPPRSESSEPAPQGRPGLALRAAEERVSARLRSEGPLTLRAVYAHRQAVPDTLAICGQVNPTGRGEDPFIPFVAVVRFEDDRAARVQLHIGATSPEATRVYFEMVDRCFDGGGPPSTRAAPRPLPPAPTVMPNVVFGDAPPAPAVPSRQVSPSSPPPHPVALAPAGPPQGSVVTRQPANVRSSPSGGGEVLRVAPRGSNLQVFGEAPGGWFQVGEHEPWGWVHGSLLDR